MHLELEELQKPIDGAPKYAAADGAAAGRDRMGWDGNGGTGRVGVSRKV